VSKSAKTLVNFPSPFRSNVGHSMAAFRKLKKQSTAEAKINASDNA
jgi:hypothetical protein